MTSESAAATRVQVETLRGLVEAINAQLAALQRESAEGRSDQRVMARDLANMEKQLNGLVDVLHRGNGKPSISARILLIETRLAEVAASQAAERARAEKERSDRERFERESRNKTTLAVIGGMFGLASAAIAAIAKVAAG